MALVLASKSPRRKELLSYITKNFIVQQADTDETPAESLSPKDLAQSLAKQKAEFVFLQRQQDVVVGSDTVVDVGGLALGKPQDAADARRMLGLLSGRRHLVHTGVCVFVPKSEKPAVLFAQTTEVWFEEISMQEIDAYVATGDPFDKAGAYGIQSGAAKFVQGIEGCYNNVVGLPVAELYKQLKKVCPELL